MKINMTVLLNLLLGIEYSQTSWHAVKSKQPLNYFKVLIFGFLWQSHQSIQDMPKVPKTVPSLNVSDSEKELRLISHIYIYIYNNCFMYIWEVSSVEIKALFTKVRVNNAVRFIRCSTFFNLFFPMQVSLSNEKSRSLFTKSSPATLRCSLVSYWRKPFYEGLCSYSFAGDTVSPFQVPTAGQKICIE